MIKAILLGAALAAAVPAAAVSYTPVGPQANVALATVTGGGWTLCYSATMGTIFGSSAATTLANCTGTNIMLAGRETGSGTLLMLAQTTKVDALTNTGAADNGNFTTSNGADWFYADDYSWGFKPVGTPFTKNQCDFSAPAASLCVHTLNFTGGFSIGTITGLNDSSDYEKLVFTSDAIPEPASWAMLIAGFGLVGAMQRRRRSALAA